MSSLKPRKSSNKTHHHTKRTPKRQESIFECFVLCFLSPRHFYCSFLDFSRNSNRSMGRQSVYHSSIQSLDHRYLLLVFCVLSTMPSAFCHADLQSVCARLGGIYDRMKLSCRANVAHGSKEALCFEHNTTNNKRTINWK